MNNIANQQPVTYSFSTIRPSITIFQKSSSIPQQTSQPIIRAIKMIKLNQNADQRTQYFDAILRMSQQRQKPISNSSAFDRIRFANQSNVSTVVQTDTSIDNTNQTNNQMDCDEDIIIESVVPTNTSLQSWSGFLIDNCDEVESSPISPPNITLPPAAAATITASVDENKEEMNQRQNAILLDELNEAHLEQRRKMKRQKRIRKTLQRKTSLIDSETKAKKIDKSDRYKNISIESSSDEVAEYNATNNSNDQLSQLIDTVQKTSTTVNDADKSAQISLILEEIKKQQLQLKKLSQYVSSMLDNREQTNDTQHNTNQSQDILTNFLNQPLTSGCWLCSGKTYTEVATQCDYVDT